RLIVIAAAELVEDDQIDTKTSFLPYDADALRAALRWLDDLEGDASPRRIVDNPPPAAEALPLPAITSVELETLAMTSIVLSADVDVDFYIEQPVDTVLRTFYVAARKHLAVSEPVVRSMLLAAPPRAHELAAIRDPKAVSRVLEEASASWTIRTVNGKPEIVATDPKTMRDGDVVVIPAGSRVCVERVPGVKNGEPLDDVTAQRPDGLPADVILPLQGVLAERMTQAAESDPILGTRATRRKLAEIVADAGAVQLADRLARHRRLGDLAITWCTDNEDPDQIGLLVVVTSEHEGRLNDRVAADGDVPVDDHCDAVAARMTKLVAALDALVDDQAGDLVSAARLHDEGKRHPEFQRRMGARPEGPALAKPTPGHKPDRGDGWRHEQLSAAFAHARLRRALVTALVGAHHGAGLPIFDRDADAARAGWCECPPDVVDALAALFGAHGRYEADRVALQREHGVHRLAYLEALMRCADIQVSREGQQ
ncbi:MAG: HD domain-containing protein, partial [Solirubrobacteraceae bacterium]